MFQRETVNQAKLNKNALLPFQLRLADFEIAMQDVYDFFYDVNKLLLDRVRGAKVVARGLLKETRLQPWA